MNRQDIQERREALASWAEVSRDAVRHIEGYEYQTFTAIYYVMTLDEAEDFARDEAEQDLRGLESRMSPGFSPDQIAGYWDGVAVAGRATQIAIDAREHQWGG